MRILKRDLFGTIALVDHPLDGPCVERDTRSARWWCRGLARRLARREAHALRALAGIEGVPRLLAEERDALRREWIEGEPLQRARAADPDYYRRALALVRRLHARGVTHDDLAKEPNWLVTPTGAPALVDFQLARCAPRRGRLFRMLAHDDLRHLFKHKRTYLAERLTARQRRILARPSPLSRLWKASGKPVYLFVTRRIFGWADREGAGDRQHRAGPRES